PRASARAAAREPGAASREPTPERSEQAPRSMTPHATSLLALLVVAALLSACAHLPVGGDGLGFEERRVRLEAFEQWEMRGRLAVDTPDNGGFQGSFEWRQRADHLTLAVRGPLGAGALRVAGTPSALEVTTRG